MKLKGITIIKNYGDLVIGKRFDGNSQYYYYRFYVGKKVSSDGYMCRSLQTRSKYDAKRLAVDKWKKYHSGAIQTSPNESKLSFFAEMYIDDKRKRLDAKEILYKHGLKTDISRIEKSIYDFFGKNTDVRKIDYHQIREYLFEHLKDIKGKTRLNYKKLLSDILKFAVIQKCIEQLPVFPETPIGEQNSHPPYTNTEVIMFKDEIRRRIKSTDKVDMDNNRIYRELGDYIDFCRFSHLRPGKEILLLQHKHLEEVQTIDGMKGLVITPATRKVKKNDKDLCFGRPLLREIYVNRIIKRNPIDTGNEYLFFNYSDYRNDFDIESLLKKVHMHFKKLSQFLNLYKSEYGDRPIYSLRATGFMDDKMQGFDMEEIAKNANSSTQMFDTRYLSKYSHMEKGKMLKTLFGNDKRNPKKQK